MVPCPAISLNLGRDPALARRVACAICGWDAYLTSDVAVLGEPARGSRRPGCFRPAGITQRTV